MKVAVDRNKCTGHARCHDICPEVFGSDELGYCVIADPDVPKDLEESAARAVANCPEGALQIVEPTRSTR